MAYKMSDVGGWGTGALGDITNPSGQINSYANVTAISTNTVTIGTASNGIYETFAVGKEILLHVSAVLSGTDATKLGKYLVATITGVSDSVLTLSKDVAANLVANADLSTLVVQAITVAQFNTLTLSSGSIAPIVYSTTNKYGGVIALKCKTELVFSGGSISLVDKGIPTASSAMRPLTAQETEMIGTGKHTTGWENHITSRQALMNCGDGVAMLWAKKTTVSSASSRIGGTTAGVAYYPYAKGDNSPAEVLGGSTILLASETIDGFAVSLISKGKGTGTGYGRCYIATETRLPNDEGLYAQDCLSNPTRLRDLGITGFGDGRVGDVAQSATFRPNTFAPITAINAARNAVTIGTVKSGLHSSFTVGETVCVHVTGNRVVAKKADNGTLGRFVFAKIIGITGSVITIDKAIPEDIPFNDYYLQLIAVPQYKNLTFSNDLWAYSSNNSSGDSVWPSTKAGGVMVVLVKDTLTIDVAVMAPACNVSICDPEYSGYNYRPYIPSQCSGQQKNHAPVSQGPGAYIILARNIVFGANGAISTYNGAGTGDRFGGASHLYGGGFCGGVGSNGDMSVRTGGYSGSSGKTNTTNDGGPWPTTYPYVDDREYSNTGMPARDANGHQGFAGICLFIVADTISGFAMKKLNTGGQGYENTESGHGGSGYGAGPGGGSGTSFIYVNNLVSPDYTGAVI